MSYRDDLAAAVMRADAGDRENAALTAENQRLVAELAAENQRFAAELAAARDWVGGPRKRLFLGFGIAVTCIGLAVGGILYGQSSVTCPSCTKLAASPPVPSIIGAIVADGPQLGHWTLTATRCVPRSDGIQLTTASSEAYGIWLTSNVTEVEMPRAMLTLLDKQCTRKLSREVTIVDTNPTIYSGHIELDCSFDGNRLLGRIEFRNCR
jgi:hypothetical protein